MSAIPKVLVRSPITAGYKSLPGRSGFMSMIRDGRPWLTWQDIEGMRRDPMVSLGLRILRAPIAQVTFKSYADNPRISKFSLMQLKRFWRNSLGHALTAFDYGNSAAEPLYRFHRRLQQFDRLNRLSVHDVRALEYAKGTRKGEFAGLRVRRLRGGSATDDLVSPWCFWLALDPEPGTIAGISRLHAVLEPWREKRGRHGAVDSRRLYHHKCAFTGGMFRYPEGSTNLGTEETPRLVANQDIAREVLEKFENGGILVLPNTKDPVTGDFLWNVEFAQYLGDAPGLLEYPKILDKEIMTGLGIPPEIVEASTVGSGYSGRAIPAQVFFASLDEVVNQLLTAVSEQIIKPLVEANFGPNQWFEIEAQSLAEKVAGQPSYTESRITDSVDKVNRQPQPMDQGANGNGDQFDPLDALRQAAGGPQRLSNEALARRLGMSERAVEAAALEAERLFPQMSKITRTAGGLQLAYKPLRAPKGGVTIRGVFYDGGEFIPSEVAKTLTKEEREQVEKGDDDKPAKAKSDKGKKSNDKENKSDKPKKPAPGSQIPEETKAKLREVGMVGSFPPADVPFSEIKFADLSEGKESLKFKALMSWDQKTHSGRISRQYRYTQEFADRNAAEKHERVAAIEPHIEKIAATLAEQMKDAKLPAKKREAAAIANTIRETGLRPTDGDDSVKHGHFGISSLQARHAKVVGNEIHLDFIGKEGVRNLSVIRDPVNVAFIRNALKGKKDEDFIFTEANSNDAGAALKAASVAAGGNDDIKIKDLRTLKAHQIAKAAVEKYQGPPPPLSGDAKKDGKAIAAAILSMATEVAAVLNNQPTESRDTYVHPEIWKEFQTKILAGKA